MDREFRIQRCNRAAEELVRHPVVGRRCWEVVHGAREPVPDCLFSKMCLSGCRESAELQVGSRWYNCTVDPIFDRRHRVSGAVHVLWDITGRKLVETSLDKLNEALGRPAAPPATAARGPARFVADGEKRLRRFIKNAPVAVAMFNRDMRYLAASARWVRDLGLQGRPLIGRSHYEVLPEIAVRWHAGCQRGLAGEVQRKTDDRFERADGSVQWLSWESRPWFDPAGAVGGIVIFTEDMTERKQTEQLLRKTNRTLQAVRECHEAMLRARTEKELLDDICRIIVQSGSGRMAWVGFAKTDARKSIRPIALAGPNPEFVKRSGVTWADIPRGRGPTGTAIRTGKPCLCRNTFADPGYAPWREAARRRGYGSLIALPLLAEQHCFGALVIYARQVDGFDVGDQLLFTDLANDLAFGINTLRLRAEHERLEKEIIKSSEREQARIGRDLHDGLCQVLIGAKFRSVYLQKIAGARSSAIAREARALEDILDQAIQQARSVAGGLNPVRVTPAGLAAALRKLAEDVDASHRAHCFCQFPAPVKISDHRAAYHLYRIAQEAVQNALRHGGAKNISITLAREDKRVVLTVKDDGFGMPAAGKKSGMGINNMQTRARLMGGRLEIRRRKRGGTAVSCELPANQKQSHDPFPEQHTGPAQAPDLSGG
jgi:PAS domain S-box-containing protein